MYRLAKNVCSPPENVPTVDRLSNPPEQHSSLPQCCSGHVRRDCHGPEGTFPGTHFQHSALPFEHCAGRFRTPWGRYADSSQAVKHNKDNCTQMLEQIHQLLYAIIRLHMNSDTGANLTPGMLDNLGKLAQYVYYINGKCWA
jgi:hypothetical protein